MTHLSLDYLCDFNDGFYIINSLSKEKCLIPRNLESLFEAGCEDRSWTNDVKFCMEFETWANWLDDYSHDSLIYSEIAEGYHFEIFTLQGYIHWIATANLQEFEGMTSYDVPENPSHGAHDSRDEAIDEACEVISLCSRLGFEAGITRWDMFNLMMNSIPETDARVIYSIVEKLPEDLRFERAYILADRVATTGTLSQN